jgi:hypothetical protein
MSFDPEERSDGKEAAEHLKRIAEHLAEEEKEIKQLDEGIREAERKSKNVIRDPES